MKYVIEMGMSDLEELVTGLGAPSFRVKQIRSWVFEKQAIEFGEMTNLPAVFREKMTQYVSVLPLNPVDTQISRDGTVKTLFSLPDGKTVESALMLYASGYGKPRTTVCISSQVGCPVGCSFCATGQQGYERNLTQGEIAGQVLYWMNYLKKQSINRQDGAAQVTNVVFMGMGEPLLNYSSVWEAINIINRPDFLGIGARNITISTAGVVPGILKMAQEPQQIGLAVSLHAAENPLRDKLVPINRHYPLEKLIPACHHYVGKTGRRVSFEYLMIRGINDMPGQAKNLADLLVGMNCHVNLIPANLTENGNCRPTTPAALRVFLEILTEAGVNVTVRQSRGSDILAGCGQLKSGYRK